MMNHTNGSQLFDPLLHRDDRDQFISLSTQLSVDEMNSILNEESIHWDHDPSGLPFVRQLFLTTERKRGPIRWGRGVRIGYANLQHDLHRTGSFWLRRFFYVKRHDLKWVGHPMEAVTPTLIGPGYMPYGPKHYEPPLDESASLRAIHEKMDKLYARSRRRSITVETG